ncbi:hypothetical protein Bpfe_002639 [Biomphalaria pfeifferi]|uniref:Uncharacterized protein n=1 Tax=Biomphalaria pfeifferi TaxID=112525 RepID=A0AAD8C822_BIOPF|nr:hypothetical protein Bpfe_002639 [Biomphalaria pfeifferi]
MILLLHLFSEFRLSYEAKRSPDSRYLQVKPEIVLECDGDSELRWRSRLTPSRANCDDLRENIWRLFCLKLNRWQRAESGSKRFCRDFIHLSS